MTTATLNYIEEKLETRQLLLDLGLIDISEKYACLDILSNILNKQEKSNLEGMIENTIVQFIEQSKDETKNKILLKYKEEIIKRNINRQLGVNPPFISSILSKINQGGMPKGSLSHESFENSQVILSALLMKNTYTESCFYLGLNREVKEEHCYFAIFEDNAIDSRIVDENKQKRIDCIKNVTTILNRSFEESLIIHCVTCQQRKYGVPKTINFYPDLKTKKFFITVNM